MGTEYQYQTQTIREAPEIEAYKLGLLGLAKQRGEIPVNLPHQQVAGLSALQQQGQQLAGQGIGNYQGFMQRGANALTGAGNMLSGVGSLAQQSAGMSNMMPGVGMTAANAASLAANAGSNMAAGAVYQGMRNSNPYMQGATQAGNFGQGAAQNAMGMSQGLGNIGLGSGMRANQLAMQGSQGYDPRNIGTFMDPYQQNATRGMLSEMNRQASMGINDIRGAAVGRGAFGGSRHAVAEQEYLRGVGEQKNRLIADQYSRNFQQAQGASMGAHEANMQRLQNAGQTALGAGQLGIGGLQAGAQGMVQAGQMGSAAQQQSAQLGLQNAQAWGQMGSQTGLDIGRLQTQAATQGGALALQGLAQGQAGLQGVGGLMNQTAMGYQNLGQGLAGMGQLNQGLAQQDAKFATVMGAVQQENQQKQLDTAYRNEISDAYEPFQRIGFMSDIYKGAPSSQSSIMASSAPSPSTANQVLGTGIQALAAYKGYETLFGN